MNTFLAKLQPHEYRPLKKPLIPNSHLALLLRTIRAAKGIPLLVGGSVRDHLLGLIAKDFDIEVFGLSSKELEDLLSASFKVIAVGRVFGIFKVIVSGDGEEKSFDVATPRTENKSGSGHKGFVITTDPFLSFKEAAMRRDFTINAMAIDCETQTLIDPFQGEEDLSKKLLKHVSPAFSEDPLRVLRAAQFCARFDLRLDKQTIALCHTLKYELLSLSHERIFEEIKKLLLSKKPSLGLAVLKDTEALILFPELENLIDCQQEPEWHPEGDVWIHSLMVTDEAAHFSAGLSEDERLIVVLGALCHDLGKPSTTILKDGRIKSPAHEQAGVAPTLALLIKMGVPKKWHDDIASLVREHLKPFQLYAKRDEVSDGAIRRLLTRVAIDHLLLVSKADFCGRTTKEALSGVDPSEIWLKEKVHELMGEARTPSPLLQGRHLMQRGLKPGPDFAPILKEAFEAQLDGTFSSEEEALNWLDDYLAKTARS